jgi:hypothetical protein
VRRSRPVGIEFFSRAMAVDGTGHGAPEPR